MSRSDGSTASYYELPEGCSELQELISHRDMNAQIGEIFRACYRYGIADHSDRLRDAKKMRFYADAEIKRLEKLQKSKDEEAVTEFFKDALAKTLEPAAMIDDDSPRAMAIGQNGNTGLHYDFGKPDWNESPPWATHLCRAGMDNHLIWTDFLQYQYCSGSYEGKVFKMTDPITWTRNDMTVIEARPCQ